MYLRDLMVHMKGFYVSLFLFYMILIFLNIVMKMEEIKENICLICLILIKLHKYDEIV